MYIAIPVFEGCSALVPLGARELFIKAMELHQQCTGQAPDIQVEFLGTHRTVMTSNGVPIRCQALRKNAPKADLIFVPALDGNVVAQLEQNRSWIPWLQESYAEGADLTSACTGAFMLAEAGLLDGRRATTHWSAAALFRQRYPKVTLMEDRLIVDQGRVVTCGGATYFINLVLYLVEKHLGAETARLAAHLFLIDPNRDSQSAYAIFSTQKNHGDQAILKAQRLIEERLSDHHAIDEVAHSVALSRRTFVRRFKAATGSNFQDYVHRVKVETVKKGLEMGGSTFEQMALEVGYRDVSNFRQLFQRCTGLSPSDYRRKYGRLNPLG